MKQFIHKKENCGILKPSRDPRLLCSISKLDKSCILLSCQVRVSESTHYSFPECQGAPCSKQVPYLKFN